MSQRQDPYVDENEMKMEEVSLARSGGSAKYEIGSSSSLARVLIIVALFLLALSIVNALH